MKGEFAMPITAYEAIDQKSLNVFKKLSPRGRNSYQYLSVIIFVIAGISLLLAFLTAYGGGKNVDSLLLNALFLTVVGLLYILATNSAIKIQVKEHKDTTCQITFYEGYFTSVATSPLISENANTSYQAVKSVVETNDYFFVYPSLIKA